MWIDRTRPDLASREPRKLPGDDQVDSVCVCSATVCLRIFYSQKLYRQLVACCELFR